MIFSCSSQNGKNDLYAFRQPAEFETQEAIWLIWPSTHNKESESGEKVTLKIIEAIAGEEKVVVTCKNKELFEHAKEVLTKLSKATDQDRHPFHIIRMTLPPTTFSTLSPGNFVYDYIKILDFKDSSVFPDGGTVKVIAALSYLNFIITNKVIIGQTIRREGLPIALKGKDEKAAQVLQSVFPNRKVVMIDALAVNLGGGEIHCISMQQPASFK